MKKIYCIISNLVPAAFAGIVSFVALNSVEMSEKDLMFLFSIIIAYGGPALLGIFSKIIHLATKRRFFGVIDAIVDMLFTICHAAFAFLCILQQEKFDVTGVWLALALMSLISFIVDIKLISELEEERDYE